MIARVLLAALFSCLCGEELWAYRPLTTEDASVMPGGKGELELSYDFAQAEENARTHTFLVVAGFGVRDRAEFSLELPFILAQSGDATLAPGLGDIRPVAKFLLLPEKKFRPGIALQAYFKFDTGDEPGGKGTGEREAGFFGILSKRIGDFQLHGMLGLDFVASGEGRGDRAMIYGIAVDYTVGRLFQRPFHVVTEVFGNYNVDPDISFSPASWLLGAIYEISPAWTLDAGVTVGLAESGSDFVATFGSTFAFP